MIISTTNKTIRPHRSAFLLAALFAFLGLPAHGQPPADWAVNPSAYEFSMTLIFTCSIDGWVGGDADVAAVFDAEGVCRGVEEAGFYNAETGWYTGLMLVYANNSSLPGLSCSLYDVSEGMILASETVVNFQSNASLGSLNSPIILSAVSDPSIGCMDPDACNYLPTATTDNGSCVYPGCTDEAACNYEATPACPDNNVCTYAESGYDCAGNCLSDFDGDGICDGFEVSGCTDEAACNYDSAATDDDCSCAYPAYPYDCNGDCFLDADGDGICDGFEVAGCTDPEACEFDPLATDEDGSCTYCCFQTGTTEIGGASGFGLAIEPFAVVALEGVTHTAWRVYVTTPEIEDRVLGVGGGAQGATFLSSTGGFYQHPAGSALASTITPALLQANPELIYDSWLTVGLAQQPAVVDQFGIRQLVDGRPRPASHRTQCGECRDGGGGDLDDVVRVWRGHIPGQQHAWGVERAPNRGQCRGRQRPPCAGGPADHGRGAQRFPHGDGAAGRRDRTALPHLDVHAARMRMHGRSGLQLRQQRPLR